VCAAWQVISQGHGVSSTVTFLHQFGRSSSPLHPPYACRLKAYQVRKCRGGASDVMESCFTAGSVDVLRAASWAGRDTRKCLHVHNQTASQLRSGHVTSLKQQSFGSCSFHNVLDIKIRFDTLMLATAFLLSALYTSTATANTSTTHKVGAPPS
jgi:hypothetical protein